VDEGLVWQEDSLTTPMLLGGIIGIL